jgi:prepilin-type N-terminal cleavage/methylation domain-containing protein
MKKLPTEMLPPQTTTAHTSVLSSSRSSRRGFTLIELAITLAIISIMIGWGMWSSQEMLPRWRTRATAQEFSSRVQQCRMIAIRAGVECRVLLVDYDTDLADLELDNIGEYQLSIGNKSTNSDTWDLLPPDSYSDGTDDDQSEGIFDIGPSGNAPKRRVAIADWGDGQLGGPGVGNENAIVFDARGYVSNPSTDFSGEGNITVTFVNKLARSKGLSEDYIVYIGRSGMIRIDNTQNEQYTDLYAGTGTSSTVP